MGKLRTNKYRGRTLETQTAQNLREIGYHVRDVNKHTKGYDMIATKRDPWTGKKEIKIVECKAGRSQLTKSQKELRKKHPRKYKVVRNTHW